MAGLVLTIPKIYLLTNFLQSFRVQIFLALSSLIVLLLLWLFIYLRIENKTADLNSFTYEVQGFSNDFSKNTQNFQSFLLSGYKEASFYTGEEENNLTLYIENLKTINTLSAKINLQAGRLNIDVDDKIYAVKSALDSLIDFSILFNQSVKERGFKDYGNEGRMRLKAHALESNGNLPYSILLQLRRHEKDYILRGETEYAEKLRRLADSTLNNFALSENDSSLLVGYRTDFDVLVSSNDKLGIHDGNGMYGEVVRLQRRLAVILNSMSAFVQKRVITLKQNLLYTQIVITLLMALISIFLAHRIVLYFTKDIKALTADISLYINSNFRNQGSKEKKFSSIKEIQILQRSYGLLKQKLTNNINSLEKTTELAKKNADFKSQFLANMSHEIRSPLNGIIGMLNILKWQSLNEKQTEYVEIAENSADHLLSLVNMILDHSKLEAGKVELDSQTVNLENELKKLMKLFRYQAGDKKIELRYFFDENIHPYLSCDILRLQQVLINLLDNAVKFTEQGYVELRLELLDCASGKQKILFTLKDTGVGFDEHQSAKLLEAFQQADVSTTRRYGGTGLGLAIVDQLIALMGGKLEFSGKPNKGSVFQFALTFDIAQINNVDVSEVLNIEMNTQRVMESRHALVVEDNVINQKVIVKMLERLNITADVASDGRKAIDLFLINDYNMIFMDIHMPNIDGYEATTVIKASPKYLDKPVPIIAITASAFEEDKSRAYSIGMDDFIVKPIVFKKLQEIVAKYEFA